VLRARTLRAGREQRRDLQHLDHDAGEEELGPLIRLIPVHGHFEGTFLQMLAIITSFRSVPRLQKHADIPEHGQKAPRVVVIQLAGRPVAEVIGEGQVKVLVSRLQLCNANLRQRVAS